MMSTLSVSKEKLNKLSDDVLRLISLGKYTLYKASSEEAEEVTYLLRTGAREFFVLDYHGQPLDIRAENCDIKAKMAI